MQALLERIARNIWLACFFLVALIESDSWKYLPLRTLAHKEVHLVGAQNN
jgi:hypothetical protein